MESICAAIGRPSRLGWRLILCRCATSDLRWLYKLFDNDIHLHIQLDMEFPLDILDRDYSH